jgi:hypothetical protein
MSTFSSFSPPKLAKPKPVGLGDAKQLSSSFTRPVGSVTPRVAPVAPLGAPGTIQKPGDIAAGSTESTPSPGTVKAPAAGATQSVYDLSTDPIVQKIRALNINNYDSGVHQADAARKQLLIDSGFGDLARATQFGSLEAPQTGDEATALAAQTNPFSIAANLMNAHQQAQGGIDQADNNANLFFSSTRGNHLGDEAHQYLGNVASAQGQIRQQLTDLVTKLLSTKAAGQQSEADAISQARQNAINNAIASGQTFAGYDANGNPIFNAPAATPPTASDAGPSAITPDAIAASLAANPNASKGGYEGATPMPTLDQIVAAFQAKSAGSRRRSGLDG